MKSLTTLVVLFFVREGLPSEENKQQALQIASKHSARVSFRNSSVGGTGSTDFMEACGAVAGLVPKNYAEAFPRISLTTFELSDSEVTAPVPDAAHATGPIVVPKDKAGFQKALTTLGVDFHPTDKLDKLKKRFADAIEAQKTKDAEAGADVDQAPAGDGTTTAAE